MGEKVVLFKELEELLEDARLWSITGQFSYPEVKGGVLPFGGFFCQDMTGIGLILFYFPSLGFPKSFSSTSIRFYFGHSFTFLNLHYCFNGGSVQSVYKLFIDLIAR